MKRSKDLKKKKKKRRLRNNIAALLWKDVHSQRQRLDQWDLQHPPGLELPRPQPHASSSHKIKSMKMKRHLFDDKGKWGLNISLPLEASWSLVSGAGGNMGPSHAPRPGWGPLCKPCSHPKCSFLVLLEVELPVLGVGVLPDGWTQGHYQNQRTSTKVSVSFKEKKKKK